MPRGIYVPLPDQEREALFDLADREWRRPVDQAIKLISDGLREAARGDGQHTTTAPRRPGEAA